MAIAHVQSSGNGAGAIASLSITVSALTAGNCIIVGAKNTTEARTLTPSATGVTFTTLIGPTDHSGAPNIQCYIWIGTVDTGGATTVTLTLDSGTDVIHGWVAEFSGLAAVSPLDQSTSAQSAANQTSHDITGTLTTTQADELLIGSYGFNGLSGTLTPETNFTAVHTTSSHSVGQWRIVSATGSYDAPMGTSNSLSSVSQMVTLKGAISATPLAVFMNHYAQQGIC